MNKLADLAISDSGFVFDPYTGATFSMNATGLHLLRALRDGASRPQLIDGLAEAFDLRSEVDLHRDVDEFVALMRRNELLPADFELEG